LQTFTTTTTTIVYTANLGAALMREQIIIKLLLRYSVNAAPAEYDDGAKKAYLYLQ